MSDKIICFSKGKRELLDKYKDNGYFGFGTDVNNNDQMLFIAALGMEDPKSLDSRDNAGWTRDSYIKDRPKEEALFSAFLLGKAQNDEQLDDYAEMSKYIGYVEKCAEKGFDVFEELLFNAENDKEILHRRMLSTLDNLYLNNVKNDI